MNWFKKKDDKYSLTNLLLLQTQLRDRYLDFPIDSKKQEIAAMTEIIRRTQKLLLEVTDEIASSHVR